MYRHNQLVFPSYMNKETRFFALAGFSLNGPVGTPFVIKDGEDPYSILGETNLAHNYLIAKENGITPLILRLNGSHAESTVTHEQSGLPVLRFTTLEAKDECNNISIHLFPTHMIVEGLYNDHLYYFADHQNISSLSNAIKTDLYYGKGEVDVEVIEDLLIEGMCLNETHTAFSGADDGFNYVSRPDEETDTLEKTALQIEAIREQFLEEDNGVFYATGELSNFKIDTLLFTDIAYEHAPQELTEVLGRYAQSKTEEQKLFCSIVLGSNLFSYSRYSNGDVIEETTEIVEEENINEAEMTTSDSDTLVDRYAADIQTLLETSPATLPQETYLSHVEVVIGTQDHPAPGYTAIPCATSYACMRFNLPMETSATNKAILSISSLYNEELLKDEVAKLTSSGYICIVPSIKKGFVPFSSKNSYLQTSLRARPHYLRTIHNDVRKIAGFFDNLIGSPLSETLFQTILNHIQDFTKSLLVSHPFYKNISIEVLSYDSRHIVLSIVFDVFGEVERVKTSFSYQSSNEVTVVWEE